MSGTNEVERVVMFRYRDHRAMLDDSLATTKNMDSLDAIKRHLMPAYGQGVVKVKKYGNGIDERCGWNTHIVTHNGNAVGFTDGPVDT